MTLDAPVEEVGMRGTTAGFYILLAALGLVGLMIGAVYLTRQENLPQLPPTAANCRPRVIQWAAVFVHP